MPDDGGALGDVASAILLECRKVAGVISLMRCTTISSDSDAKPYEHAVKLEEAAYDTQSTSGVMTCVGVAMLESALWKERLSNITSTVDEMKIIVPQVTSALKTVNAMKGFKNSFVPSLAEVFSKLPVWNLKAPEESLNHIEHVAVQKACELARSCYESFDKASDSERRDQDLTQGLDEMKSLMKDVLKLLPGHDDVRRWLDRLSEVQTSSRLAAKFESAKTAITDHMDGHGNLDVVLKTLVKVRPAVTVPQ